MNGSDQDSDSIYTTNQPQIVEHARYCQIHYPTIVNNIPKESNHYNNTPESFALIDNNLAASQRSIGESSNLAQICLTYTYNFPDQKYQDYVCILSVIAQAAIDSAKRRFDIDIPSEIKRIKRDMDIETHGYPAFWSLIRRDFNKAKINPDLICPMNYLYTIKIPKPTKHTRTLPMNYFFQNFPLLHGKKRSKKVESFIEQFSVDLYKYNTAPPDSEQYLLLREDFDAMIKKIRELYIPSSCPGIMSWLINRGFAITHGAKVTFNGPMQSTIRTNKSILIKTLYDVNSDALLAVFSKNLVSEDLEVEIENPL